MRMLATVALAAVFTQAFPVYAAVSAGSPFAVAQHVSLLETHADVAMRANGEFVVAWERFLDLHPLSGNVLVRRFAADGSPLGKAFLVTSADGHQGRPSVALADDGRFLVAWHGAGAEDPFGIYARVFEADGSPGTDPFLVHEPSAGSEEHSPSATKDGDGFAVTWSPGVQLVRLDARGNRRGEYLHPDSDGSSTQVRDLPDSKLAIAWSSVHEVSLSNDSEGEVGRVDGIVLAASNDVEREFRANDPRPNSSYDYFIDGEERLSLATSAGGAIAVAHDSRIPRYLYNVDAHDGPFPIGARLEVFGPAGETVSTLYLADFPPDGTVADVAMSPGGNSVVSVETGSIGIRAVDCRGIVLGDELVQASADGASASASSIAVNERGEGVVIWSELDSGQYRIRGRTFALGGGCALCGDADGSGTRSAADALLAIRTAVGAASCPLERCDVDDSSKVGADDALRILRVALSIAGVELTCMSGPRIEITDATSFHASPFGWEALFSISSDGVGAIVTWSESGLEGGRTFSRRVSADLELEPQVPIAGPDMGTTHLDASGCGNDGAAVAWSVVRHDFHTAGLLLDLSTVHLALPGGPVIQAHPDSIGEHRFPSVTCLSDGRYAVSWMSRCGAIDRGNEGAGDEVFFRPDECDEGPVDGANVRVLEADGSPSTGALSILPDDDLHQETALAALEDGFVAAAGSVIQVRSNDGDLLAETNLDVSSNDVSLACLGNRCVRADNGRLLLFDADDVDSVQEVVVQPVMELGPTRSIVPVHTAVACEAGGVCVAAWLDQDVNSVPPYWSTDDKGLHVRAFDLATGKLGESVRLPARGVSADDVGLAAVSPGVFVLGVVGWYRFELHRIELR